VNRTHNANTHQVVKVCAKAEIVRKQGHKKRIFVQIFNKAALKEEFFDRSKYFW